MNEDFYFTDSKDPDAPVRLDEYHGLRPGMNVRYENPQGFPLHGTFTLDALYRFGNMVQAVMNDGEYEVLADNLVAAS